MRLIDANALMRKFEEFVRASNNSDFANVPTWNDAVSLLASAPTITVEPKCDQLTERVVVNDLLAKIVGSNLRCLSCVFRRDDICFFAYECVTNDFRLYEPRKR